jgi:hypothetical protein
MKTKQKRIVVTGDVTMDRNLYFTPSANATPGDSRGIMVKSEGGAKRLYEILKQTLQRVPEPASQVEFGLEPQEGTKIGIRPWSSQALWEPQEWQTKSGESKKVWRLSRNLGYELPKPGYRTPLWGQNPNLPATPDILVLDDGAMNFRFLKNKNLWPAFITGKTALPGWIVYKVSAPICQGDLWRELVKAGPSGNFIVVMSVNDLRREEVCISKNISWERTVEDIVREFTGNPAISELHKASHVVIGLQLEGVLLVEKVGTRFEFRLIFDPFHMEDEWVAAEKLAGEAYGYMSCLTAGIVQRLAEQEDDDKLNLVPGIKKSLSVMRLLRQIGHGEVVVKTKTKPGFPFKVVANLFCRVPDARAKDKFSVADIPVSTEVPQDYRWQMLGCLDTRRPNVSSEPLYGIARRVALFGPQALTNTPLARFAKLLAVDRDEIEALRNIKALIKSYAADRAKNVKPLSLAVFGPPGAGKSFGIKQVAEELRGDKVPILEFNLSQFASEKDLIGAFHQVRDKVLEGEMPFVFWDEFDSQKYLWLKYLLAPMQDGKFQEGQITHPIGKCVFIFAGATSYDWENFGPPKDDQEEMRNFKLLKGPDFKSRVSGYLNVLGPNRRQILMPDAKASSRVEWKDDTKDICFPLRRAILIRAILGLTGKRENEFLDIDRGLLSALLEIDRYEYGARSVEKIVQELRRPHAATIRQSDLPSDDVLQLHVNVEQFRLITKRLHEFQSVATSLAPHIHEFYRDLSKRNEWPFKYDVSYDELPEGIKADNIAAGQRIPLILELVDLIVEKKTKEGDCSDPIVTKVLVENLEWLAAQEHDMWMAFKHKNGWVYGEKRNDDALIHNALVRFADLSEKDKEKDRDSVRNFPRIVELAGYKIVARRSA